MARIDPIALDKATPEVKKAFIKHVAEYKGGMTNMKATLGHSLLAFEVYMHWYPLYEAVQRLLGARMASIYAYAISSCANCPLSSTFFRKIIVESGEKPEQLLLKAEEQLLVDFGSAIARSHGNVSDQLFRWLRVLYNDEQLVLLVAFAGQMIATSVFNNAVGTEIDSNLVPYLPFVVSV